VSGFAERVGDIRLLSFEVCGHVYALPIDGVLEVAETGSLCGVPTLARTDCAVMNWHGDALPLVSPRLIFADAEADVSEPLAREHVLVISDRGDEVPRLGIPIDAVLGIVVGSVSPSRVVGDMVVERRPVDGRVVSVLDSRRLLARAQEVIERLAA
jgi:chemotaxis signal transduction protein